MSQPSRHIEPVPEAALHPQLRELLAYWHGKRGGRELPARADLDALELRPWIGHILMVDVVPAGDALRFRYRLFGTEFVYYHGRDLTGHWLDEIANVGFRDELLALYRAVVREHKPQFLAYDYVVDKRRHRFQAVLLPLSSDGRSVDIVLGCGVRIAVSGERD